MALSNRLLDLLGRMEDSQREGKPFAPKDLSADCPRLLDEVKQGIEQLQALAAKIETWPGSANALPSSSSDPSTLEIAALSEVAGRSRPAAAGERYQVLRFHKKGGLGEVHVALDTELNREVALKKIQAHYQKDVSIRYRFLREAEITARLEHPGVVPVHGLIEDADGQLSYAMRLIQGSSFRDAIAAFHDADKPGRDPGERSLSFRQLLQRFLAVCNTVAYAHSRGIIHRDLKPANIMLGKFGETLVVDWGLGKSVGRSRMPMRIADQDESTLAPTLGSAAGETRFGELIGTPAFMSPEQAAGNWSMVGPLSDIYSLGTVLYELLTGTSAFPEPDLELVLFQVQQGEFQRPKAVKAIVPPGLEAICLKAMARRPDDRYESVLDLTADVEHWLADEPVTAWPEPMSVRARRWMRRQRTTVAAAAASVVVAAVILAVMTLQLRASNKSLSVAKVDLETANQELQTTNELLKSAQTLAEENAKDARRAVDRYYLKVSREVLLRQPQFLALRRSLLEEALKYYERLLPRQESDASVRREFVQTLDQMARLTRQVGRMSEALGYAEKACRIWSELAEAEPSSIALKVAEARAYDQLATVSKPLRRFKEARAAYDRTIKLWEELVQIDARSYSHELAYVYDDLQSFLSETRLDPAAAWEYLHKGLAIMEPLVQKNPDNEEYVRGLAYFYNNRAQTLVERGKLAEALVDHEKAIGLRRRCVRQWAQTDDSKYAHRQYLARSLMRSAEIQHRLKNTTEAQQRFEEARGLFMRLVNEAPAIVFLRNDLAECLLKSGRMWKERRNWQEALAAFNAAAEHLDIIASVDPENLFVHLILAETLHHEAQVLVELKRRADARAYWQRAKEDCRRAATGTPPLPSLHEVQAEILQSSFANNLALRDHVAGSADALERRILFRGNGRELFGVARDLAFLVSVAAGSTFAADNSQMAQKKYADLVVEVLREADAASYQMVGILKADKAFDSMKHHEPFKKLVAELEKKASASRSEKK